MAIIGAHVSTAGGVYNCFKNAENIGAQAIQIFGASPRMWRVNFPTEETLKKYQEERKRTGFKVFLHAPYLANLATPNDELYAKSVKSLTDHLKIANMLEAEGLVYHVGSYKNSTLEDAEKRVAKGLLEVLKNAKGKADLIMENASGGGHKMGITPEEIGRVYKLADDKRIKVCIDTCHAFAAGQLKTFSKEELKRFKNECDDAFGLENLVVLHVNDSKAPFDSGKDRHENIGDGEIGLQAFKNLAQDEFFNKLPWLLEVPGTERSGPDKRNVEILKKLQV